MEREGNDTGKEEGRQYACSPCELHSEEEKTGRKRIRAGEWPTTFFPQNSFKFLLQFELNMLMRASISYSNTFDFFI